MCCHVDQPLTFESVLKDPLIRLVMNSDGVTEDELAELLAFIGAAVAARAVPLISDATAHISATHGLA